MSGVGHRVPGGDGTGSAGAPPAEPTRRTPELG